MAVNETVYFQLKDKLSKKNVTLVAVSKTKPVEDIQYLYDLGQRDFGENYVQELVDKQLTLPSDIRWHFIGHLQSNKVKYIAPFVHMIQGVDSFKLLQEINKQAIKIGKVINCLLQIYIATEDTKFGLNEIELKDILSSAELSQMKGIRILGLMGMASFTDDVEKIKMEFRHLVKIMANYPQLSILSFGMSSDYQLAIEEGTNIVRIGSLLFGSRD